MTFSHPRLINLLDHGRGVLRILALTTVAAALSLVASPQLAGVAAAAPKPAAAPKAATAKAAAATTYPSSPPAAICGNVGLLTGPATPPVGAIVVAAGDDSTVNWNQPGATFWFAPGTHTLGSDQYSQIIAANNATYVGAPGAVMDGQGINMFAFTQTASGVAIRYLTIQNYVALQNQGVVNHDSGVNWTISNNTIINNHGAAVMIGPGDVVTNNCLKNNGQYGFNAVKVGGNSNVTIDHNEITGNNTGNWEVVSPGCGCDGAGKLWNTAGAQVTNNWVHNNLGPGIWADYNNSSIVIDGNYIADNDGEAIIYEISYNGQITNNNVLRNAIAKGKNFAAQGSTFPIGSIYISESGGDSRISGGLYSTFAIAGNNLVDNWGGVTLWENADRFCGAPGNGSFCTMVNPAANAGTCVQGTINNPPYLSDCRWKTQNVSVHDNTFSFSRANVGCTTVGCGMQALISNFGTQPSWSPYLGNTVINAITTQQNNHFTNNTYIGDWTFAAGGSTSLNFSSWQGNPYGQDPGSTFNGSASPPPMPNNLLDSDTSGFEGSVGRWAPWFSSSVAQSTAHAEAGTHSLQVSVTAPYGWGIQTSNFPGFTASPGAATLSFWGLSPNTGLNATMTVQWRDSSDAVLSSSSTTLANLSTTWQQASATVTAPAGTAYATVTINGTTGGPGSVVYLDQISLGAPTGTPAPAQTTSNLLDPDSATLEGSAGRWSTWFSANVAQTTAQAHSGTHSLLVNITAPYGWGVQLSNFPGFPAAPGPETVSFWGLQGSGSLGVVVQVQWRDAAGNALGSMSANIASLTGTWQKATASGTAPAGTAYVSVTFTSPSGGGVAGNSLYVDDIVVAPAVNLLDADTASIEGSAGRWATWFSTGVAQSSAQAQNGGESLQVTITAPYGWGVQTNNWPGFAAVPGPKNIAFWAMAGASGLNATMQVQWRDATGKVLATNAASLPTLTGGWQQASAAAVAPPGTAFFSVTVNGTTGVTGNAVYLDQFYVGN